MAILKRKTPHRFWKKAKEAIWPSMGWYRTFHYYRHRIFRGGSSTYRITSGLALGMAISFTPFIGTHFLQVAVIAPVIRASMFAGFAGTVFGNPWTFPILYMIAYKIGFFLCSLVGFKELLMMPDMINLGYFLESPFEFLSYLFSNPIKLLLPLSIGGYVCCLLFWPFAYLILYKPVEIARIAYIKRHRRYK
jgi:uncharacterized protein (DUF2062 family)